MTYTNLSLNVSLHHLPWKKPLWCSLQTIAKTMDKTTKNLHAQNQPRMKIRPLWDCHTTLAFLLVIQNTFNCTSMVLSRQDIKTIGLALRKVFSLLCPIKDNLGVKSPLRYSIPWECGKVYIGQICCFIKTRVSEHCHIYTNWGSWSWWSTALTLTIRSYSVTGASWPKIQLHGLACKGSNRDQSAS